MNVLFHSTQLQAINPALLLLFPQYSALEVFPAGKSTISSTTRATTHLPCIEVLVSWIFLPIVHGVREANCQQHLPEHTFPIHSCPGTGISSAPVHKAAGYQRKEPHLFHSEKKKEKIIHWASWRHSWTSEVSSVGRAGCCILTASPSVTAGDQTDPASRNDPHHSLCSPSHIAYRI